MDDAEAAKAVGNVQAPIEPAQAAEKAVSGKATARPKAAKGKPTAAAEKSSSTKASKPAAPAWTFPKNTLEDAIKIALAIEEQNAGNPMKPDILAKAAGYNSVADWRFLDRLRSASQYGLVTSSGKITPVGLTEVGRDVVAPASPSDRPRALFAAFRNVEDFKKVEEFYKGKKLPEDEFFENNLHREFGIPRERVKAFIENFTSNLNYLHAFRPDRTGPGPVVDSDLKQREPDVPGIEDVGSGRQFLDTCFVMMPFGQWMDTYYREIFIPAVREAGLEPVRADELFSTAQ